MTSRKRSPRTERPVSGQLLKRLLADIDKRLNEHRTAIEALQTYNKPNGHHTVLEHHVRAAIAVHLDALVSDVSGLGTLIAIARRGR